MAFARLFLAVALATVALGPSMAFGKAHQSVITSLDAKWGDTPFLLEAAEILNDESPEFFWSLMDFLSLPDWTDSEAKMTKKEKYTQIVSYASRYLSQSQLNLYKFGLSLRIQSPKVQMFQQMGMDYGVDKMPCEAVVQDPLTDKLSCLDRKTADDSIDSLLAAAKKDGAAAGKQKLFQLDHHYPHRDAQAPALILYAQAGTKAFAEAHKVMAKLASEGRVDYVLRPFVKGQNAKKPRLSGYGVELQIKSTEYKAQDDRKVEEGGAGGAGGEGGEDGSGGGDQKADTVKGFDFSQLKQLHPDKADKLGEFRQHLIDQSYAMAPLKVWELQDLSLQAAARIMSNSKYSQLDVLEDISQNFPSHARSLSSGSVPKDLKKEIKRNRETFANAMGIGAKDSMLLVNGLQFDLDYVDVFTLFDTIKAESKALDGLGRLGLDEKQAGALISLDLSPSTSDKQQQFGVDIRSEAVNWINDIEKDKVYGGWPSGVEELLRPTFPGMLRSIRKNFFHMLAMCDPSKPESAPIIRTFESFYTHRAPTKIGFVFTAKEGPGVLMASAFWHLLKEKKSAKDAIEFLVAVHDESVDDDDAGQVTEAIVKRVFEKNYGGDVSQLSAGEENQMMAQDFAGKTGLREFPQVLMNGFPLDKKSLSAGDELEEAALNFIMRETQTLQRTVYNGQLTDRHDVLDYLMQRDQIMPRLNDRILGRSSGEQQVLDFVGDVLPNLKLETFAVLDSASKAASLANSLKYLTLKDEPKLNALTAWIVADLETAGGRSLLKSGLEHLKTSPNMRMSVVHNTGKAAGLVSRIVQAAIDTQSSQVARSLIAKVVKKEATVTALESGSKLVTDYDIPGADMKALSERISQLKDNSDDLFQIHKEFVQSCLPKFEEGQGQRRGLILNGKVIGPLDDGEQFDVDDFGLLDRFSMSTFGEKLVQKFYSVMHVQTNPDPWQLSNKAMKVTSLLSKKPAAGAATTGSGNAEAKSRVQLAFSSDQHSVIRLDPVVPAQPAFDIVAVVDPTSQGAQKAASLLKVLRKVLNARVRVFLNCVDKHSEMPQRSYFRMVLQPEPVFASNDEDLLAGSLQARFVDLPKTPIYTMHHHVPENWMTAPVKSVHDLDNIKLESIDGNVYSEFELEHLLLEGHCFEQNTGNPPRGLQLTLGTVSDPLVVDTIVMANLGYLQLKSNPGRWFLNIREGRSSEIYGIASHENTQVPETNENGQVQVLINSFKSAIVKLKVSKKKDEELLQAGGDGDGDGDDDDANAGLWGKIKSTFSGGSSSNDDISGGGNDVIKANNEKDDVINIFCLASGHMYERLLKIMMLSVIKHTDAKVKFWVLANYLSPDIKEFLPQYSKRYGFEYEFVQYKWPRWLNQQKEKQRIIWGYKILFLDVLFPLDVKKIIFVDTDQIVRSDLRELRDMDMRGAPYGYTPFCDSNKDMEGFRFWKSGYWKSHLAGRKYHISALYVVDLVKFRQIAAGDRLRGQYQALSQDPNSLANLDQDLPNNMIHQVPIFSLPQEWLYCETWCAKDELKNAKSIDLCNNPLTKEPKLVAARRIVSEWTDYDDEMHRLANLIKADLAAETANKSKSQATHTKSADQSSQHTEL